MDLRLEEIRELCRQFSALHDGQLSADEIAALEQKLRDNPSTRRLYVRYSRVCAGLSWDTAHSTDPLSGNERSATGIATAKKRAGAVAFVTDLTQSMIDMFSRPGLLSLGLAGLVGAALGVGLLLTFLSVQPADHPQLKSLTEAAGAPEIRSLKLESGAVTLSLANIGHVIVEGPAQFDLLGPMRSRLAYGRIKMRVTEEAGHGFVVETPGGEVVDFGTEFGLDVDSGGKTSLAVFEGIVDLRMPNAKLGDADRVERFEVGEGAVVGSQGKVDRLMLIVTGNSATFRQDVEANAKGSSAIISNVTDNLRKDETKKFYQIVPGGLREDALSYVDRPETQWNGVTNNGIPSYLLGANYVKTFNEDKLRSDVKINVTLSCPARLFVFFDDRLEPPDWLRESFRKTTDKIGLDFGPWGDNIGNYAAAKGAGVSIDATFTIWEKIMTRPGIVTLEHNPGKSAHASSMYGIAAIALARPESMENTNNSTPPRQPGARSEK